MNPQREDRKDGEEHEGKEAMEGKGMDALRGIVFVAQVPSQPPAVIVQYPPQQRPEQRGQVDEASQGDSVENTSSPRLDLEASTEDLRHRDVDCFGIPAMIFAKLMLPDEELCNRLLYLELDAGHQAFLHDHDVNSHLHFVSFPCNVSEFSRPRTQQQPVGSDSFSVEPREKVQRFNLVHILDANYTERHEQQTIMLWQVSAHLSRALVTEEARVAYVSREVRRMTAEKDGKEGGGLAPHLDSEAAYGLEQLLADMFAGVKKHGCSTLRVNGSVLCQVCAFPKHDTLAPPTMGQALVLTTSRDELQQEMPSDSADTVRLVLDAAMPTISLGELTVQLALPLSTLQRIAQHLIYWRKARLVDVYRQHTRVVLGAGVDHESKAAQRFHEWQKRLSHKFKPVELTFPEVISAFSRGHPLQKISEQLGSGADFDRILEWLVAEGLVEQLATFVHFLPSRAEQTRSIRTPTEVNAKIRRDFSQHLSDEELWLLAARSADNHQHLFLCRFVVEFARAHCRTDDSRFAELASRFHQADTLIKNNSDIFVSYVCRC